MARLFAATRGGKHEVRRIMVLTALARRCLEIFLNRRLVKSQGTTGR
jgi:hypothetical protein